MANAKYFKDPSDGQVYRTTEYTLISQDELNAAVNTLSGELADAASLLEDGPVSITISPLQPAATDPAPAADPAPEQPAPADPATPAEQPAAPEAPAAPAEPAPADPAAGEQPAPINLN